MRKRVIFASGLALLSLLVTLLVWQGSFSFGDYGPSNPDQTYLFWALSTLIFLLTLILGFILFRTAIKLYVERQHNREGSRIQTKLVAGALALTFLPVSFLVLWSFSVLNRTLDKWFSRPAQNIRLELVEIGRSMDKQLRQRAEAQARWLASTEPLRAYAATGVRPSALDAVCREGDITAATLRRTDGPLLAVCGAADTPRRDEPGEVYARQELPSAELWVHARLPIDLEGAKADIDDQIRKYDALASGRKDIRNLYLLLLLLITLFILFIATWVALFFARQISRPIAALLAAAGEVKKGNLGYRVNVNAIDELATLVRGFNSMTEELEANARELERRRRFTEAILESIPSGVISVTAGGRIQRYNPALAWILPSVPLEKASHLEDLFARDDASEIRYLMKRARRTGVASRQFEIQGGNQVRHLSVTVSALESNITSGFVIVIEDTSDLLKAQKTAAWHEVARRIAHEIKNPLTPIQLSTERIARHLERANLPASDTKRILQECTSTILREVESVKGLVNAFSQFARFPTAKPAPGNLNEVVDDALNVFHGRLDGIDIHKDLARDLPPLLIDREQMKRVIVNLVDNAAEAMQDSFVKRLAISTQLVAPDTVELLITDTGAGVTAEDKEKLFLPYFSTKGRGTGLGLAIVAQILSDHNAHIRIEDNKPTGARFIVDLPVPVAVETEAAARETETTA